MEKIQERHPLTKLTQKEYSEKWKILLKEIKDDQNNSLKENNKVEKLILPDFKI